MLETRIFEGLKFHFRPNSTDENCFKEVVLEKCYRHKTFGLDVEEGEKWLDLGGNIGCFALYCKLNGATCVSFEPEDECFSILKKNIRFIGFQIFNAAITNSHEPELVFYTGMKKTDFYRNSVFENKKGRKMTLKNLHAEWLENLGSFDGIKLDIEGSEFGLIDDGLLPKTNKLVMEYHLTKDRSMANFHKRMDILRDLFDEVYYMPSLDKFPKDGEYPGFFDRIIYAKNKKL